MKIILFLMPLLICAALSSCASPAMNMSDGQIAALGDDQLCNYNNTYRSYSRTRAEMERRGLNCNRHYRNCLKQGNAPDTQAMQYCIDLSRENERLRYNQSQSHLDIFGFGDYDDLRSVRNR